MKKIWILFVNIFIFVFIFLAADYIFGYHVYCLNFDKKINIFKFSKIYIEHICDYDYYFKNNYRQTACPVTNSPPPSDFASDINQVILVGCSYTFGSSLEDEETFQYLLEKQINHPVYNLGICSGSPREILYILNDKRFLNSVVNTDFNNIKYIIYTFIPDHLHRLYFDPYIISPHFVVKKDKTLHPYLVYKKEINILRKFYLYQYYTQHIMYNIPNIYKKENLFNLYIYEINKEIKKNFKNAKFIILVYWDDNLINWDLFSQEGIQTIKVEDITNENMLNAKYQISEDDPHPNKKAWELIVPEIAKYLT